ncbi:MAG: fumarate hydratase [Candidatus Omnitrophica bacterium]|nr:fumarate hydratase [Candidatus Omnitrophota bacterium]
MVSLKNDEEFQKIRIIPARVIQQTVGNLCLQANTLLRKDVIIALNKALAKEKNQRARICLKQILDNAQIARSEKLAICQDTGLPSVFIEIGSNVHVDGNLYKAVSSGVMEGYRRGYFRDSVVIDPLERATPASSIPLVHTEITGGRRLHIIVLPKGFGCENKTRLKMFLPTASKEEIIAFIIETVSCAGADACPPYIVGVGIGGTADYACFIAKKALLRPLNHRNSDSVLANLEDTLLKKINRLGIGPMGLGGKTTALAVKIEKAATHIAGLPVCVNISCHALRSAEADI